MTQRARDKIKEYEKKGWNIYELFETICKREGINSAERMEYKMNVGDFIAEQFDVMEEMMSYDVNDYFEANPDAVLSKKEKIKADTDSYSIFLTITRKD